MPIMIETPKWILYKHTCDYELIKAVALDVKNSCAGIIGEKERKNMQDRLEALKLYKMRNPQTRSLDSINHRINTLEFYMFGYEENHLGIKRFIFSPLGNLFLNNINKPNNLVKIFTTMLFAIQFKHWANGTPDCFSLYPFRLLFKLMQDDRLNRRIYSTEYAYLIAFVRKVDHITYEKLVSDILSFRNLSEDEQYRILKSNEHLYVNCIYEWQYYTQKLLSSIGILNVNEGEKIGQLFHPSKANSASKPTGRWLRTSFAEISPDLDKFVSILLDNYPETKIPVDLSDKHRMQLDIVKEIYSFYPDELLEEIGEKENIIQAKLLKLPELIEKYSNNPNNETAYLFEDILEKSFNLFINVEAKKIGGSGHTDIECLFLSKKEKFAVEAKSTENKLLEINSGRLRKHRAEIGGKYTIVLTPRYVPSVIYDIVGQPIVIILANTFSEYIYNHVFHGIRDMNYKDFDDIILNNLGSDVSSLISQMTMQKFATKFNESTDYLKKLND